jgi:hypothetical protein
LPTTLPRGAARDDSSLLTGFLAAGSAASGRPSSMSTCRDKDQKAPALPSFEAEGVIVMKFRA